MGHTGFRIFDSSPSAVFFKSPLANLLECSITSGYDKVWLLYEATTIDDLYVVVEGTRPCEKEKV